MTWVVRSILGHLISPSFLFAVGFVLLAIGIASIFAIFGYNAMWADLTVEAQLKYSAQYPAMWTVGVVGIVGGVLLLVWSLHYLGDC